MSLDNSYASIVSREELGALLSSARAEHAGSQKVLRPTGLPDTGPNELTELARRFAVEQGRSLSTLHQTAIRFRFSHREELNLRQFASALLETDRVARLDLDSANDAVYLLLNRSLVFGWMMLAFGARPDAAADEIPARAYTAIEERFIARAADNVSEIFGQAFSPNSAIGTNGVTIEDPVALYVRSKRPYCVISFDAEGIGEAGILRIALPLSLLDESQMERSSEVAGPAPEALAGQIFETAVEIHVELGFGEIALRDLAQLAVGDELRLERSSEGGLVVNVEEAPKFRAEPGKLGKRLAVRITDEIQS